MPKQLPADWVRKLFSWEEGHTAWSMRLRFSSHVKNIWNGRQKANTAAGCALPALAALSGWRRIASVWHLLTRECHRVTRKVRRTLYFFIVLYSRIFPWHIIDLVIRRMCPCVEVLDKNQLYEADSQEWIMAVTHYLDVIFSYELAARNHVSGVPLVKDWLTVNTDCHNMDDLLVHVSSLVLASKS